MFCFRCITLVNDILGVEFFSVVNLWVFKILEKNPKHKSINFGFFFLFFFHFCLVFIDGDSSYNVVNYSEIISNNIYVIIFSSGSNSSNFEDSDFTYYKKNGYVLLIFM